MSSSLTIEPLTPEVGRRLSSMTFPAYRHLLELDPQPRHPELGEVDPIEPFGFVGLHGDEIAGLALAEWPNPEAPGSTGGVVLLSVFVRPQYRRQGLARRLVAAVEEAATSRQMPEVAAVYTTGKPGVEFMERIFSNRGWQEPVPGSVLAHFTPQAALGSPFYSERMLAHYRDAFDFFPWREIQPEEMDHMRRTNAERCWIEPSLEPWKYEPTTVDASSVGARHRGEVVGWVLNHCVVPGVVRFSISYLRPDLARRAKILALYHASLSQLAAAGNCRQCTFTTPYSYGPMVAFVHRAIKPFASFVGESRRITLNLVPEKAAVEDR